MTRLSTHAARPPPGAASRSSSSEMVNRFAAPSPRARPGRPPVLPQSARATCSSFSHDVDADGYRWGDGLRSWSCSSEEAYLADVRVRCSQMHRNAELFLSIPGASSSTRAHVEDTRSDYDPEKPAGEAGEAGRWRRRHQGESSIVGCLSPVGRHSHARVRVSAKRS